MPHFGRFEPNTKYRKAPVWVCYPCLAKPQREHRKGQETPPEHRVREALQVFGEYFVCEHKVGPFIFDFAFPRLNLLMEVDSYTYHHSKRKRQVDAKKEALATSEGWKLVRVSGWSKIGNRAVRHVRARRLELIRKFEPDPENAKIVYQEKYGAGGN